MLEGRNALSSVSNENGCHASYQRNRYFARVSRGGGKTVGGEEAAIIFFCRIHAYFSHFHSYI